MNRVDTIPIMGLYSFKLYLTFHVKIEPKFTGLCYYEQSQFLLPSKFNNYTNHGRI